MRNLPKEIEYIPIDELMLSVGLCQTLVSNGYDTLGHLLRDDRVNSLTLSEELLNELTEIRTNLLRELDDYFTRLKRERVNSLDEIRSVEDDMCVHKSRSEKWQDRLFAVTPLIGDHLLKKKTKDDLYRNTKVYIDYYISGEQKTFTLKENQQITLAIIHAAQDWDPEKESKFWRYISACFGYADKYQQVSSFFIKCMKAALDADQRFRITDQEEHSSYNAHKATILAHALAPKRTWKEFCDLLFDFFRTELYGTYQENNRRTVFMVENLYDQCKKGIARNDDSVNLNGQVYHFQEGLRKLISYRPGYMLQLIDYMLKTMGELLNHQNPERPLYRYIDKILQEWFEEFQNLDENVSLKKKFPFARQFSPRFIWRQEDEKICITCSDTLLGHQSKAPVDLKLYMGGRMVCEQSLIVFDSEYGKVVKAFQEDITSYLSSCDGTLRMNLSINEEKIYDSQSSLYRKRLCFQGEKEIRDISRCHRGDYMFFVTGNDLLTFQHAETSDLENFIGYKRAVFVRLGAAFEIIWNGQVIARDASEEIIGKKWTSDMSELTPFSSGVSRQNFTVEDIKIHDKKWNKWPQKDYLWVNDIERDASIYVSYPTGSTCELWLDNIELREIKRGEYALGEAVSQYSPADETSWAELKWKVRDQQGSKECVICCISQKERFIKQVKFTFQNQNHSLHWNFGGGFIGSTEENFQLIILNEKSEEIYRGYLELDDQIAVREFDYPKGRYRYKIEKKSNNFFAVETTILAEGFIKIGSEDELRFHNCRLKICHIIKKWKGHGQKVRILTVYIDQLIFQGKKWIETENEICPIYKGVLFFYNQRKERCEFSFSEYTDEKGKSYYKVNPVTIIYIPVKDTLKIISDEGYIYYYRNYNKQEGTNTYFIVDHFNLRAKKDFYDIPQYFLYTKEEPSC